MGAHFSMNTEIQRDFSSISLSAAHLGCWRLQGRALPARRLGCRRWPHARREANPGARTAGSPRPALEHLAAPSSPAQHAGPGRGMYLFRLGALVCMIMHHHITACYCLPLKSTHFVSYRISDPSSTLNLESAIAFPVKNNTVKAPSLNPKPEP